jgi:hypothetical protein
MTPRVLELARAILDGSARDKEVQELARILTAAFQYESNATHLAWDMLGRLSPDARGRALDHLATLHRSRAVVEPEPSPGLVAFVSPDVATMAAKERKASP